MNDKEKKEIISALEKKGATYPCPACNKKEFTLLNGYFHDTIEEGVSSYGDFYNAFIPSIVMICNNCGYIRNHAVGSLEINVFEKEMERSKERWPRTKCPPP